MIKQAKNDDYAWHCLPMWDDFYYEPLQQVKMAFVREMKKYL